MAEIVRRWMWVFIRVEWEVVRNNLEGTRRVHQAESIELNENGSEGR
jgi:hypothetical protein